LSRYGVAEVAILYLQLKELSDMNSNLSQSDSIYRITLEAGVYYSMEASVAYGFTASGVARHQFYNVTDSEWIGAKAFMMSVSNASHYSNVPTCYWEGTFAVDTDIEVRIEYDSNISAARELSSYWHIESHE